MTPDQRRNLPPQAQKQYSERPITRDDVIGFRDSLPVLALHALDKAEEVFQHVQQTLTRIADGVGTLTRNLDAAEDTLALIAANGPVGVKMAVAKAQRTKPPPFPLIEPLEWRQTATGEYYIYRIDRDELRRALIAALGFDESYQLMFRSEDSMLPIGVRIAKGDQISG